MSAADAQTLARSLNDAVVAAGNAVVTDAVRQQVWSLLGSNAQEVLRALCEAGEAPAVAGSTEPAAATKPRTSCGIERFPEDVLGAIIAFVDLPMRFTCVAACSTLRDACARVSPRLEHSLLAMRFPLINAFGSASALEQHEQFVQAIDAQLGESDTAALSNRRLPAPRDLFRTFKDFEGENTFAVRPDTSITLKAYVLSLEIKALKIERAAPGGRWGFLGTQKSIYVGTGELQSIGLGLQSIGLGNVTYKFTVPEAVRERVVQLPEGESWSLLATVVASRRGASDRLQFAKLYQEHCSLDENGQLDFDSTEMPLLAGSNPALNFIKFKADNTDMWTDPVLDLLHNAGSGSVEARFKWKTPDNIVDMTAHEARCCLEHYVAWSE